MAEYFVPKVLIEQEFTQNPTFAEAPLAALVIGPQYQLFRYDVAGEKAGTLVLESVSPSTNVNTYAGSQLDYTYSQKSATSTIDLNYVKVYFDQAELEYFSTPSVVTVNSTNRNIISSAAHVFKTGYGDTLTTAAEVLPGDKIIMQDASSNPTETLVTKVRAVTYSNLAATVPSTATPVSGGATEDTDITVNISGTYTGTKNIKYRIIVEQGGAWGAAKVKVLSDDVDSAGPFLVTNSTGPGNNEYNLGTKGLKFRFTAAVPLSDVLLTGNEWTVSVTAAAPDKYNVLELEDNIPSGWASTYIGAIRIVQDGVLIPQIRDLNAGTKNWVATQAKITINASIQATNARVSSGGVLTPLDVKTAKVYVERRDLLKTNINGIASVSSTGSVETKLGTVHPDNALAKGVYNAVLNSSGTSVYYVAVGSNDLSGYLKALELARKDTTPYNIVPLSQDPTIIDSVVSHVEAMSASKQAKWRIGWISRKVEDTKLIYDLKSNGNAWQAYVSTTPGSSPTTYSFVTIGYDNGSTLVPDADAKLLNDAVRAGDELLYNFRLDVDGNIINDVATVTSVTSQNTLIVDKDFGAAVSLPFKVQIRRTYTTAEKATAYKALISGYNDRRTIAVFPDTYKAGTVTETGDLLAAACAGACSGAVPHQSLTNTQILGPTDLSRVVSEFTEDDLDLLAAEGCFIVTQAAVGASAYVRDQLTSDQSSLNKSQLSITKNVDSISRGLQKALAPFVGIYNINAGAILKVRAAIDKELNFRMTGTYTETAGTQLLGYTIDSVAQDTTFKDKLVVKVTLQVPYPMNYITVTLVV